MAAWCVPGFSEPPQAGSGRAAPYWSGGAWAWFSGGVLRRLVRRHDRVAGQRRDPAAPSGPTAPQPDAAYGEIRRILTSGGRAVLTNWEPLERNDQRLPGRLRRVDLGAGLTAAGFEAVEVRDRPGWRASEHAMWQEAAALDPGDDRALR